MLPAVSRWALPPAGLMFRAGGALSLPSVPSELTSIRAVRFRFSEEPRIFTVAIRRLVIPSEPGQVYNPVPSTWLESGYSHNQQLAVLPRPPANPLWWVRPHPGLRVWCRLDPDPQVRLSLPMAFQTRKPPRLAPLGRSLETSLSPNFRRRLLPRRLPPYSATSNPGNDQEEPYAAFDSPPSNRMRTVSVTNS